MRIFTRLRAGFGPSNMGGYTCSDGNFYPYLTYERLDIGDVVISCNGELFEYTGLGFDGVRTFTLRSGDFIKNKTRKMPLKIHRKLAHVYNSN
jgi:hypothetical protein